jgi:hypothetical protein
LRTGGCKLAAPSSGHGSLMTRSPQEHAMKLRLAVSALSALAVAAGAPALALAQTSSNVEASTPVPNPPSKTYKAHHPKAKTAHRKAAATTTTKTK